MQSLKERVRREAKHLGNGVIKVDSFLNHQIDSTLMENIGQEFARRLSHTKPNKILTVETSGIAPALATGIVLKLPVVYARKHKPITMAEKCFHQTIISPTHGTRCDLTVSSEYLVADDRVLVIDDILASHETIHALCELIKQSGATLVGIGVVIEKEYSGGRKLLADLNVPVEALVTVTGYEGNKVIV